MKYNWLNKLNFGALFMVLSVMGCKRETVNPINQPTGVDFSTYIAIGDSQTAGYTNDGLYRDAQLASFPAIIARQMKQAGGGDFEQPLFAEAEKNGSGFLTLDGYSGNGSPIINRVTTNLGIRATLPNAPYVLYNKYTGNTSNYGVSGLKLADINDKTYGNKNPFFERLLTASAPNAITAYADLITAKPHKFFSCWLGNNDALAYALTGGADDSLTGKATFDGLYRALINKLTAQNQKGVVATIPDVTSLTYFNTLSFDSLILAAKKKDPAFKGFYISSLNAGEAGEYITRLATSEDLLVLNFDVSRLGTIVSTPVGNRQYGISAFAPIESKYVLDPNEMNRISEYISAYNSTIKSVAAAKGLALFDAAAFLHNLMVNSFTQNGITYTPQYIKGGLFSLDGIHLTAAGNILLANEFIKAINSKYGTAILPASL